MEYDDPSLTQSFPFPKIYQFPPFFTHQVNERTWHSQLVNWNSLILAYCRYYRIYTLDLSRTSDSLKIQPSTAADTPTTNSLPADSSTSTATSDSKNKPRGEIDGELFWNRKINRALQTETIQAIFQYMVVHGNAAWLDQPNTSNTNKGSYDDFDDLEYEQQFDRFEQIFNNFPLLSSGANSNNTNNKTCILLYWRQPQEWASLISDWVCILVAFPFFFFFFSTCL